MKAKTLISVLVSGVGIVGSGVASGVALGGSGDVVVEKPGERRIETREEKIASEEQSLGKLCQGGKYSYTSRGGDNTSREYYCTEGYVNQATEGENK